MPRKTSMTKRSKSSRKTATVKDTQECIDEGVEEFENTSGMGKIRQNYVDELMGMGLRSEIACEIVERIGDEWLQHQLPEYWFDIYINNKGENSKFSNFGLTKDAVADIERYIQENPGVQQSNRQWVAAWMSEPYKIDEDDL